jgi:hypothetical protein
MKAAAEEANDPSGQDPAAKTLKTVSEPGAATAGSPLAYEHWVMLARKFSNVLKDDSILLDETAHSTTSSNETKDVTLDASPSAHHVQGGSSTGNSAHSATPHSSPSRIIDESDMIDGTEPQSQLDNLLRLEDQRMHGDRDKSHSPDENLNVSKFPKLFGPSQDFAALFDLSTLLGSTSGNSSQQTSSHQMGATATATVTVKQGSEIAKALSKSNGRHAGTSGTQSTTNALSQLGLSNTQIFINNYAKNNWQMPEDCKFPYYID